LHYNGIHSKKARVKCIASLPLLFSLLPLFKDVRKAKKIVARENT
jgi:hypothetical protein